MAMSNLSNLTPFYTDKKFLVLALLFVVIAAGLVAQPTQRGLILLSSLIIFGAISLSWKEAHIRLGAISFLVLLAIINILVNGMHFGLEFVGGTRIPVLLEHPVDSATMGELISTVKGRVSTMGLTDVRVRAVGSSQINVEISNSSEAYIKLIEDNLGHRGVYEGVVDGKIAVSGSHIFSTSIRSLSSQELTQQGADWGVRFSVDREGAEQFASAAKGKSDYPVYMFLDRPDNTIIVYSRSDFRGVLPADSGEKEALKSVRNALTLQSDDKDRTIPVYLVDDAVASSANTANTAAAGAAAGSAGNGSTSTSLVSQLSNITPVTGQANMTHVLVSENLSSAAKSVLRQRGFTVVEVPWVELKPEFHRTNTGMLAVSSIKAVGLLSSPSLSGAITAGILNYEYMVTGAVPVTNNPQLKAEEASRLSKNIESILKGGSLPVQISLGSRTTLSPTLGGEFLKLSILAIAFSLVVISALIGLRYRNLTATMPIVAISIAELIVLLSILGSFDIGLAAIAGIIAAIGVSVDAQIVITDELLKRDDEHHSTHEKVDLAFGIIKTNAIVAIFSMVPLLFAGGELAEVIGFAMSTIIGALLGYMLTRPAYAAIVENILAREHPGAGPGGSSGPGQQGN